MKNFVEYTLIILMFIIAVIFFVCFDLENIFWENRKSEKVGSQDIEANLAKDFIGEKAGEGITFLTSKEEWEDTLNEVDYVSVVPKSIVKTDVYSLAKWVGHFKTRRNGSQGRKRAEVMQSKFDYTANYTPYYIIELEDGTHILAQMNRGIAKKIQNGEKVELPLGKKKGLLQRAKNLLKPICEEYDASNDYVLYTIDNDWEKENSTKIFIIKIVITIILFFVLTVIVLLFIDKIFTKNDKKDEAIKRL